MDSATAEATAHREQLHHLLSTVIATVQELLVFLAQGTSLRDAHHGPSATPCITDSTLVEYLGLFELRVMELVQGHSRSSTDCSSVDIALPVPPTSIIVKGRRGGRRARHKMAGKGEVTVGGSHDLAAAKPCSYGEAYCTPTVCCISPCTPLLMPVFLLLCAAGAVSVVDQPVPLMGDDMRKRQNETKEPE